MKLVTDHKIPYVQTLFSHCEFIVALPANEITQDALKDASILLTRTVTPVNAALLTNTNIQFVGSAATGCDHIDTDWLKKNHITLATASGANATAVRDYVLSCLAALKKESIMTQWHNKTAGIIGCGRIGSKVAKQFQALGFHVICYDPLLPDSDQSPFDFVTLNTLLSTADIITIHTPLTKTGPHPTQQLIGENQLKKIKRHGILINTARGEIIDQTALLHCNHLTTCLDVWHNEPCINLELLSNTFIGTPHIAGYTLEAKYRATEMIYEAAAKHFNWPKQVLKKPFAEIEQAHTSLTWEDAILAVHNPLERTMKLKDQLRNCLSIDAISDAFTRERNQPFRRAIPSAFIKD